MVESKLEEKTICTWCDHKYPMEDKTVQYVRASTSFVSMCTATKNIIECSVRNKEGKCEYYPPVEKDSYSG